MPAENKYLKDVIANVYRREHMHVMIFTYIDCYRALFPSVTLLEAAQAFMKRYHIEEEFYSPETVVAIYHRFNNDLIDMHRQKKA